MRNLTDTTGGDPELRRAVDRRMMAIVLGFVGAACLLLASFSTSWMGNDRFSGLVRDQHGNPSAAEGRYLRFRGDIRFGPLGFEHCATPLRGFDDGPAGTECRSISTAAFNDEIGEAAGLDRDEYTSGAFSKAGWLAFVTCLLSAAGLIAAAGLALARKRKELPISPASVALLGIMGAMASGCVFIATKPGPPGMLGVDLGFWAFGAGTVIGILGAQLLAKEIRPADPDLLEGAMNPDELWALPSGPGAAAQAQAQAAVPVPLAEVPPTQPVEAIGADALAVEPRSAEPAPAEAPAATGESPDAAGESPDEPKKPAEDS